MRCPACHAEYDDDMEYCPFCGNDNPNVDQREIREEQEKVEEKTIYNYAPTNNYSNYSPSNTFNVEDEKLMGFQTDNGVYTAHFDMKDEKERSAYEELIDIQGKKATFAFLSIALSVIGGVLLAVLLSRGWGRYDGYTAVLFIFFIVASLIGAIVLNSKYEKMALKNTQRQVDYCRYKVVKDGGEVLSYDGVNRTITYKLHGQVRSLRFRYRVLSRYSYWK